MSSETTHAYQVKETVNHGYGADLEVGVNNNNKSQTFETPAIRKWYIRCGMLPDVLHFSKSERKIAKLFWAIEFMHIFIFQGPAFYFMMTGIGLSTETGLAMAAISLIQGSTFQKKVGIIISKCKDAKKILHSKEGCEKLHEMVKKHNVSAVLLFIRSLLSPFLILAAYALYRYISLGTLIGYIKFIVIVLYIAAGLYHSLCMSYLDFLKMFVLKNNKHEIENYILAIEGIILDNKIAPNKEKAKQLLRTKQKEFEMRVTNRKDTMFYHPSTVIALSLMCIIFTVYLITRERTSDVALEIGTYLMGIVICSMTYGIVTVHGQQMAQGPRVFEKEMKKLQFVDFMEQVESKLGIRYELFEKWLLVQKKIATIHVLGAPINGEVVKKVIVSLTGLISFAMLYIIRDTFFANGTSALT
jgi:hypothetical protein